VSPIFEHLTVASILYVYCAVRYHKAIEREGGWDRTFVCKIKWHKQVLVGPYNHSINVFSHS
jgi:hypothetical protein